VILSSAFKFGLSIASDTADGTGCAMTFIPKGNDMTVVVPEYAPVKNVIIPDPELD
jgi:hypothetical protein